MPVGGFSPFPDNVHIKYRPILFDILPGLKAPGFLPSRSSDVGWCLTGCRYFGSSLTLADLSVSCLGKPTRD